MSFYDDNYGWWEGMDNPDMVEFFERTQQESVEKRCKGCGRMVFIRPNYDICNSCATVLERGGDLDWYEDEEE
jgi:uncharacterized OB-fold protein